MNLARLPLGARGGTVVLVAVLGLATWPVRQPVSAVESAYPRVDMATGYEVDANWPQNAKETMWASVPGVTVDDRDQIWIFMRGNPAVQVYDAQGRLIRRWDQNAPWAHGLKIDREGNAWTTDVRRHLVQKHTPEGKLLATIGEEGVPGADEKHFNMPTDVAFTPNGDAFIADGYGNARVVHVNKDGKFIKTWGRLGTKPGEFSLPHAVAIDSKQRLYVADRNNARIQVFRTDGSFVTEWRNVMVPWGIHITKSDEIWVCGSTPMRWPKDEKKPFGYPPKDQIIVQFNPDGRLMQLWMVPKGLDDDFKPGELNWVHGIGVDSKGDLYLGDIKGKRVQKFVRQK